VNFFIYFVFLFIISTLAFNIFTGIAIDEIKNLIADSNVQIMNDKITYIYETNLFDRKNWLRSIEQLKTFDKSNKVGVENVGPDEGDNLGTSAILDFKSQEAYEDDKYLDSFETLEDRTRHIENKIDQLLDIKRETKKNSTSGSMDILPLVDNQPSNDSLKYILNMIAKISQQQESITEKMNDQKEVMNELNRQMTEIKTKLS